MAGPDPRRTAPAALRNREPIYGVLRTRFLPGQRVLEVASGSGEHATFLAPRLRTPWQPTDIEEASLASSDAWTAHCGVGAWVAPAIRLDVNGAWPPSEVDWIYGSNLIHIAPFEVTGAVFDGAKTVVAPGGGVAFYGPFLRDGVATAPSNVSFDADLRSRDPRFGIRPLEAVEAEASARGFVCAEVVQMPANNLLVFFKRSP